MKTCLIQQPSGLGDILLSIKIGCYYADMGYDVVWPVFPVYANLDQKLKTKKPISFYNLEENFPYKDIYTHISSAETSEVLKITGDHGTELLFVPLKRSFHSTWGREMS